MDHDYEIMCYKEDIKELEDRVKLLLNDLREIVSSSEPHRDEEGDDIEQDDECFCGRCIAVRSLNQNDY
jgi:hypothetical protein